MCDALVVVLTWLGLNFLEACEDGTTHACESKTAQILWERGYCTYKQLNRHLNFKLQHIVLLARCMSLNCRTLKAGLAENNVIRVLCDNIMLASIVLGVSIRSVCLARASQ